jgi:hypothetical protein
MNNRIVGGVYLARAAQQRQQLGAQRQARDCYNSPPQIQTIHFFGLQITFFEKKIFQGEKTTLSFKVSGRRC